MNSFELLTEEEIGRVIGMVPLPARKQMQRDGLVLAGGMIRDIVAGLDVKDVDLFCHTGEQAERLALEASPLVRHTTFAYTVNGFSLPLQYVFYKDYTDVWDLIGQFDFRSCCAGIYWNQREWVGVAVEGFHDDCRARVLRFMSQKKDSGKLTALGRALHLAKRGWDLNTDEAAAIVTHWQPTLDPVAVKRSFRPHYGRV